MLRFAALILIFCGVCFSTGASAEGSATVQTQTITVDNLGGNSNLHPSLVNRILRTAAKVWDVSMSVLKQEYNSGLLAVTATTYAGTSQLAYDITSPSQGNVCILDADIL